MCLVRVFVHNVSQCKIQFDPEWLDVESLKQCNITAASFNADACSPNQRVS